jgi:ribonucleoside-triphosphate reductase
MKKMVQTKCEIYSRVVGYIRPVEQWHDGKQAEFSDRKKFKSEEKTDDQATLC